MWLWGGVIVQILSALGDIGPFCSDSVKRESVYRTCKPCSFHWSVFGVIEISNCENPVLGKLLDFAIGIPQLFIVATSIFFMRLLGSLCMISQKFQLPSMADFPSDFPSHFVFQF